MEGLRRRQSTMDNVLEEENPDWNRFEDYITSPDEPHKFGECEED